MLLLVLARRLFPLLPQSNSQHDVGPAMEHECKRKQGFLLRLPISVRDQAEQIAHDDGTSLNHFISLAVAEKISRMEQAQGLKTGMQAQRNVASRPLSIYSPRLSKAS